jgi:xylitol oxidase
MSAQRPAAGALTNWAGNIAFAPERLHRPDSIAELRTIVGSSAKVRVLGTGHSFNRIADTPADLVSVAGLPPVIEIDTATATATVSAGLRYAQLAEHLHRAGFALPNLASLPHISIAGACATGTHGSGVGNGNLATSVTGLRIVGPDGDVTELSSRDDPEAFPGTVVSLGALGVVTSLTLDLVPDFQVAQDVYLGLALDRLAEEFDAVLGAGYSVSVFTNWASGDGAVWLKRRTERTVDADWLGARLTEKPQHPVPGRPAEFCTQQGGVPGPWHERLPHFRPDFTPSSGEELQSEFFVPRAAAPQAIAALRGLAGRIGPVLQISEIRAIAADDLWLSPAYGRDSAAFHFTWIKDAEAVTPVVAAVEQSLAPLGARPHWGKVFTTAADRAAALYEHAGDFRGLLLEHDPGGKFRNAYLDAAFPPMV